MLNSQRGITFSNPMLAWRHKSHHSLRNTLKYFQILLPCLQTCVFSCHSSRAGSIDRRLSKAGGGGGGGLGYDVDDDDDSGNHHYYYEHEERFGAREDYRDAIHQFSRIILNSDSKRDS
jgi:hypothetical protein